VTGLWLALLEILATFALFSGRFIQAMKSKMTGILLAGGMNRRMGKEKGNIRIGDAYLYQYPLSVLEKLCDEVLISTCKKAVFQEQHRSPSVTILRGSDPWVAYTVRSGSLPTT
jgi:CTP:molybdopterin cytidylyltransferase MocA